MFHSKYSYQNFLKRIIIPPTKYIEKYSFVLKGILCNTFDKIIKDLKMFLKLQYKLQNMIHI